MNSEMEKLETGGPAHVQMTLLDYFAGKAMQTLIQIGSEKITQHKASDGSFFADPDQPWYFGDWEDSIIEQKGVGVTALAIDAYQVAHAMIMQRKRIMEEAE